MNAFIFAMVFTLGFFIYVSLLHPGINLQELTPENAEGPVLAQKPQFDPSSIKEPWVSSEAIVAYGEKLYQTNCAICHGQNGRGDGPAGTGLNPKPRDLVEGDWRFGGTRVGLYKTLTDGIEGTSMASYGHFKPIDRWAMVHYVRSITNNAPEADPEEVAQFGQKSLE